MLLQKVQILCNLYPSCVCFKYAMTLKLSILMLWEIAHSNSLFTCSNSLKVLEHYSVSYQTFFKLGSSLSLYCHLFLYLSGNSPSLFRQDHWHDLQFLGCRYTHGFIEWVVYSSWGVFGLYFLYCNKKLTWCLQENTQWFKIFYDTNASFKSIVAYV